MTRVRALALLAGAAITLTGAVSCGTGVAAHAATASAASTDCTVHVKGTATLHRYWKGTVTANRCGRPVKPRLVADQGLVNCTSVGQQATRKAPPSYLLHKLGPTTGGGACEFFVPGLYTIHWWGFEWRVIHCKTGCWHIVKVGSRHRGPLKVKAVSAPYQVRPGVTCTLRVHLTAHDISDEVKILRNCGGDPIRARGRCVYQAPRAPTVRKWVNGPIRTRQGRISTAACKPMSGRTISMDRYGWANWYRGTWVYHNVKSTETAHAA